MSDDSLESKLRDDLRQVLVTPATNRCPMACQFAWHSAATFDKNTGRGGTSGATMRFQPEFSDGPNLNARRMIPLLEPLKEKYPSLSLADIWAFAGAVSIEAVGGPRIPCQFGRLDTEQRPMPIPPNGLLPKPRRGADDLRQVFGRMGFSDQEIVALSGGHTLGRCRKDISGFEGSWTRDELTFNNEYFKNLMGLEWVQRADGSLQWEDKSTRSLCMLPTDIALKEDIHFSEFAILYARDQALFFKDFAAAYSKLLHLGITREGGSAGMPTPDFLNECCTNTGVVIGDLRDRLKEPCGNMLDQASELVGTMIRFRPADAPPPARAPGC